MNKDFAELKTNVANAVRDTSSSFASLIEVWLNNRYRRVMNTLIQSDIWPIQRTYTFTATASTRTYPMPFDFESMVSLVDTSNDVLLEGMNEQEYLQRYADSPDTTGGPFCYIVKASGSVANQPTSSSALSCVSDSASDNTQSLRIRGISDGVEKTETVTLNGTTAQSSTNSYTEVFQISKDSVTTGKVTVTSNSDAVTVAIFPPKAKQVNYYKVDLYYVPAGSYVLTATYKRRYLPLVEDEDYCALPEVADIIESYATGDAWRQKRQFTKAAALIQDANGQLQDLIFRNNSQIDRSHQFQVIPYDRDDY